MIGTVNKYKYADVNAINKIRNKEEELNYNYNIKPFNKLEEEVIIHHNTACFEPESKLNRLNQHSSNSNHYDSKIDYTSNNEKNRSIINQSYKYNCVLDKNSINNFNTNEDNYKNSTAISSKLNNTEYKSSILPVNYKNIEVVSEDLEIAHTKECGYSRDLLMQRIEIQERQVNNLI